MRSQFLNYKILALVLLITLFYIGLMFISSLVSERESYQNYFIKDISQNQISEQNVISPYLRVPYKHTDTCQNEQKKPYDCIVTRWLYIGANDTRWTSSFDVSDDNYKRSIYRAISYNANLSADGEFSKPFTARDYQWNQAEIVLPIRDARGLKSMPSLQIAGKNYPFNLVQNKEQSGFDILSIRMDQQAELITALQNGFKFNAKIQLDGLSEFTLIPTSDRVVYQAKGNWSDIKYDGQLLPFKKNSQSNSFDAQWNNIALGQANLQHIASCSEYECLKDFVKGAVPNNEATTTTLPAKVGISTQFIQSIDIYTQTDRAIKYGIMLILITFGSFFLFEILKGLRIHPIQYSLVAMAQGIFFVLLLSISEYYAFALAYVVACIACVMLMTWYLYFVMRGLKPAVLFGVILGSLYGMMYVLLQSSGKTFLMGSVLSFVLLAFVMYLTRHVNWYQLSRLDEKNDHYRDDDHPPTPPSKPSQPLIPQ